MEAVHQSMDLRAAPLAPPAAALLAGTWLCPRLSEPSVPLATALLAAGLSLGRRGGLLVAALAAGVLSSAVRDVWPDRQVPPPRPERPVTAAVRVVGHWSRGEEGWTAETRCEWFRQGQRIERWGERLFLRLPGLDPPPASQRLRVRGYVRRRAGFANPREVPPGPWRFDLKDRRLLEEEPPGRASLWVPARSLRRRVEAGLAAAGAPGSPGGALARALVLGEASALPPAALRGLRRAGLAHLLAVSGLHVGLLVAAILVLSGPLPRAWRLASCAACVTAYALVVGPRPSLLRAAIMGTLAIGALALERPPAAANALAAAVGLLILLDPRAPQDLGFLLTAAATAGIVGFAPLLAGRWSRLPPWLSRPLATSCAAHLFTLPIALPAFHLLAPFAPVWNLAAVPWTGLALVASLAWTGLAVLASDLARWLLPVLDLLAAPYGAPGAMPVSLLPAFPVAASPAAAALGAAAAGWGLWRPRRLPALLGLWFLLWRVAPGPAAAPELVVLDVGQGDSLLLRAGKVGLLVDGGGWRSGDLGGRVVLPALAGMGVTRLRALVLTHPDHDHCAGLVEIGSYLAVEEVWTAPGWGGSRCAADLLALPGARIRPLWEGQEAEFGHWRFRVLHPPAGSREAGNNGSLVLRASAAGRSALLTGDIEAVAEGELLRKYGAAGLAADLLKIPHHGSKTSSTRAFLRAVRPRLAVVSAGVGNVYGHPSPAVLARLSGSRIPLLRTDRDGAIRVRFGPGGLRVLLPAVPR